jgi:HK97 family phage major capsid protein
MRGSFPFKNAAQVTDDARQRFGALTQDKMDGAARDWDDNSPASRERAYVAGLTERFGRGLQRDVAFDRFLRTGQESRSFMTEAGSGAGLVSPSFDSQVLFALKYSNAIISRARVWDSVDGSAGTTPAIFADTSINALETAEGAAIASAAATFNSLTWPEAPLVTANGLFRVARALLQDAAVAGSYGQGSGIDINALLVEAFAAKLSRWADAKFTPRLVAGAAANTVTTATNAALGYQDLVNGVYALDLSHRGNAVIIVSPATAKSLAALVDSSGRPLLLECDYVVEQDGNQFFGGSIHTAKAMSVLGCPVLESNAMANIGSAANVAVVADLEKAFVIRRVAQATPSGIGAGFATVQRLVERYAEIGQVAFNCWCRIDGLFADPAAAALIVNHV